VAMQGQRSQCVFTHVCFRVYQPVHVTGHGGCKVGLYDVVENWSDTCSETFSAPAT